jgi:hypothetical protein
MQNSWNRRVFLQRSAKVGIALPTIGSVLEGCASSASSPPAEAASKPALTGGALAGVPIVRPSDWDAVVFNTKRGEAGAIPEPYMKQIQAPDGLTKHLGKHLPYQAVGLPKDRKKEGYLAIMWGDPKLGYTMHPNAPKSAENPEGHWYNWIRVAIEGNEGSEVETKIDDWPKDDNGLVVGFEDPDPAANGGKNSVYLARLPRGAQPGDVVRIWGHCLTHGEYVDFVKLA